MDDVKNKINYLQGLADGLNLSEKSKEGEILTQMLDAMDALAEKVDRMEKERQDVEAAKKEAENDLLKDLGQSLFSQFFEMMLEYADDEDNPFSLEESDDEEDYLYNYFFGDEDEEDEDEEDDSFLELGIGLGDDVYDVTCDNCGFQYQATFEEFENNDVICPHCSTRFEIPEEVLKKLVDGYDGGDNE